MKKTVNEAIKTCMSERNISQQKLAEKAGMKKAQEIQSILRAKKGMRADTLIGLFEAMGYELVIRDKVNDSEIVLERGEEE